MKEKEAGKDQQNQENRKEKKFSFFQNGTSGIVFYHFMNGRRGI